MEVTHFGEQQQSAIYASSVVGTSSSMLPGFIYLIEPAVGGYYIIYFIWQ
jgi:hypothetical protein